jgi:hypothetical protein
MFRTKEEYGFTFEIPMEVLNPGGTEIPSSSGNGYVPLGWIAILTPASGLRAAKYSSCSIFSSKTRPERVEQEITLHLVKPFMFRYEVVQK